MARFRQLPIWKTALDLAVHLEQAVRCFPRYHKYTLGSKLRQTAQRICRLVSRANEARDTGRVAALDDLVGAVEEMKTGHFRTGFKRRAMVLTWRPAPDPQQPFLATTARPGGRHASCP